MKFTEYVVLDRAAQAVDPLGFRRPAGALLDLLFPQFTVLTLRPSYLSALCCFVKVLNNTKSSSQTGFSRRFRELELFWGIANATVNDGVVNITKYRELCEGDVRLASVPKRHAVFQRLSYGTLGHYTSAAIRWGLVDKEGRRLEPTGSALADSFASRRSNAQLDDALARWIDGESFSHGEMEAFGQRFGVSAQPSRPERSAWKDIIREWCAKHPKTASLWDAPIAQATLEASNTGHEAYREFFDTLRAAYPDLRHEIDAFWQFERLAAATLFMFELRVAALEFGEKFADAAPPDEAAFAAHVVALSNTYKDGAVFQDARRLFRALAESAADYRALTRCVVDHHIDHQQAKGTSPVVDHEQLMVMGRVDAQTMREALADTQAAYDIEDCLDRIQFRYRRQWHFEKCRRWYDWAEGSTETLQ
ncbi:hypothetical protein [Paraburkholderia tropica]|uniref:hypothetical protein n=1 Tax=Paraburkholderia tropica TaxID=92647 RepID=UPI003D2AD168